MRTPWEERAVVAGVGVLEVAAPPGGGTTTPLEGSAPPARDPAPSLDLTVCGPLSGARTTPLARLWLPGRCWCSRAVARVLSATGPLLVRTGTGRSAPDEPIAVIVFFLGAMAVKNR